MTNEENLQVHNSDSLSVEFYEPSLAGVAWIWSVGLLDMEQVARGGTQTVAQGSTDWMSSSISHKHWLLNNTQYNQGLNRPGREADQSSPSNAEVKNSWKYPSSPPSDVTFTPSEVRAA
jgi:hypothetical protein